MSNVIRVERWTTADGRTAVVDVQQQPYGSMEFVEVSYELLAQMMTDLGLTKADA